MAILGELLVSREEFEFGFGFEWSCVELESGNPTQSNPILVPFIHLWRSMAIQERMISTRRVTLRLQYIQ